MWRVLIVRRVCGCGFVVVNLQTGVGDKIGVVVGEYVVDYRVVVVIWRVDVFDEGEEGGERW